MQHNNIDNENIINPMSKDQQHLIFDVTASGDLTTKQRLLALLRKWFTAQGRREAAMMKELASKLPPINR